MAKRNFDTNELFENQEVVALFGYLVRCNNQIHDFQNRVIKEYLERKKIPYKYVHDILFFKDDAISKDEALILLCKESESLRSELFYYLTVVSEIDGLTDFEEKMFFDDLCKYINLNNAEIISESAKKKSITERKKYKKQNSTKHTGKKANPNSSNNLFRITQKEYVDAIDRCRKIAKADYKTVKPIADQIVEKGKNFYSQLGEKIRESNDFHPEVIEALNNFTKAIEKEILNESIEYQRNFDKKGSSVEDFTIALIGRTKAGKSTLRAVLTGSGKENIGCGSQRTTRINDIYEWNHLRIIDTPGIDAGSDIEGEDQKIAENVIGEADVICYIAASDGLPKNAREFVVNIAKRNKPIIVLVNHKSNISSPSRFRRFISNPSAWYNSEGTNSIDGYFNPIKRLAEENNVESLISYKSVFLYAELISKEKEYSEYSKILSDNSGVNEFLAQLKDSIVNKGAFLRSKTILDDTISECYKWENRIRELVLPIKLLRDSLTEERASTEKKIRKAQKEFIDSSKKVLKSSYNKLATSDANAFADNHCYDKKNISGAWENYCKNLHFEEKIRTNIDECLKRFSNEIQSIMSDVFEDLSISADILKAKLPIDTMNMNLPFKELFRFAGAGLSLAGAVFIIFVESNPIGWVLTGVGIVATLVSGLFKSKAKRQQQAKQKLYNKINEAVNTNAEKQIPEIIKQLNEQSEKQIINVMQQYDNLLGGLKFTIDYCDDLISSIDEDINDLNSAFAERIVYFVSGQKIDVSNVDRKFGEEFNIYPVNPINTELCDFDRIKGMLNEKIIIENV